MIYQPCDCCVYLAWYEFFCIFLTIFKSKIWLFQQDAVSLQHQYRRKHNNMENRISVLNIKLEDAPFYKREGLMGCDDVKHEGDVAFSGKIQNVYVVCDGNGMIKSVLAYFPDDIKAIDMDPNYNLAVKYYVRQRLVAYHNLRGEIISAAEFMRTFPEVYVQLQKGLKHAHFRTERWPLFKQFEEDQYKTVKAGDLFCKQYALDDAGNEQCTEILKVAEADGSLGNCSFERRTIKCPVPALGEHFADCLRKAM